MPAPLRRSPLAAAIAITSAATCLPAQTEWTLLAPPNAPPPLTAHAMAYYLPMDTTVLFGGVASGLRRDETWLWNGSDWTQAMPANVPPARVAHSMAYDPLRGRLVMFGGLSQASGALGDTWEWDGFDWIQLTPVNAPTPRRSHPLAYLPSRGTVVLFGGFGSSDLNDTWEWNGTDWAQITTATSPPARRASDMAYDPVSDGLVLFSGYFQTADTWLFDGTDWQQLTPPTTPPARYDHTMVTDEVRDRIVMFGGTQTADTWEWDGNDWLQRAPVTLPAARYDAYSAYDLVREEVLMFGSSTQPEMWRYAVVNNASWTTAGAGCAGSAGTAVVSTSQRPWIGETFQVQVGPVPNNGIGLMLYGLSDTNSAIWGALPTSLAAIGMPGCLLQVDPVLIDAFLATGNVATWDRPLPNDPQLLGGQIYCQGAALDPGANSFGVVVGNYGVMTIGGK